MKTFVEWAEDRALRALAKAKKANDFAHQAMQDYINAKNGNPTGGALHKYHDWRAMQSKEEER